MPDEPHPFFLGDAKLVVLLLLLAAVTYGVALGGTDLWAPDEPRCGEVAREMIQRGDYVLPHLNDEAYHHKPPLYYWLIVAAAKATGSGVDSFSARLPGALMACVTILLTYLLGRHLWGRAEGFLGACAFGTCALAVYLSRRANFDTTLTAMTTLALYAFARNAFSEKPRLGWDLLFFAATGLAVLAKGPPGLGVPIGTALCFWIVAGQKRIWNARRVALKLLGIGLMLGIFAAWAVPACLRGGPDFTRSLLLGQTIERLQGHLGSHRRAFFYYFIQLPWCLFPWTIPFLFACWHLVVDTKKEDRRPVVFLFIWFVWTFAMFTASASKRETYLLPLLPSAALVVGKLIADRAFRPATEPVAKRLAIPFVLNATVLVVVGAAAAYVGIAGRALLERWAPAQDLSNIYAALRVPITWIGAALVAAGVATIIAVANRRGGVAFTIQALAISGVAIAAAVFVLPEVNPYKSARQLCARLSERLRPGDEVVMFNLDEQGIPFYLGRTVETFDKNEIPSLVAWAHGKGMRYVVAEEADYEAFLATRGDLRLESIDSQGVGHRRVDVFQVAR